ncbi:MAG: carboxylating nicotinate-nucleotide diphosphorylase [candidate division WOR-3 bacterium]
MQLEELVRKAVEEDAGLGDVTSSLTIPEHLTGKARIVAKQAGVLAGINIAKLVFFDVDPELRFIGFLKDGKRFEPGDVIAEIAGRIRPILTAERTALNFLQRLSGIATLTRQYVDAVKGTKSKILDTRKTTPLLREIEKYAVRMGGGYNHRFGLHDMILIKENHIRAAGGIRNAVSAARQNNSKGLLIEVEAKTVSEAKQALEAGAPRVLLDNMSPTQIKAVVRMTRGHTKLEASGGITLKNVRSIAKTGVNYISVGALTHSACAIDMSLELEKPPKFQINLPSGSFFSGRR